MTPIEQAAHDIGAKGSEPREDDRLAFEAWMRGHCWEIQGDWDGKQYKHPHESTDFVHGGAMHTRRLWAAWRDRGALSRVTREVEQAQAVKPVATVQCVRGVTIGYLDVMQPVGTKLYLHPAPTPAIKESLTVAELSAELDAGMAAQNYCRGLWGAARGHSDWRKVHDSFVAGYDQGRYDELQAQGPIPWPDDAPEVHYQRGYAVALSDAEEAIDDECRERVVTASDCIEIIRNLGAETEATADDADLIVAKLNALSEAQQVSVPAEILSAISRAGLTLLKTQHGYELRKLGPAIAHTSPQGDKT